MKEVIIIGLQSLDRFGILKAFNLSFDKNNRLTIVKGGNGKGKSTLQKAIKLTTSGAKTLTDNNLYGAINLEAQLLDGENKIYIGVKSGVDSNTLDYTLYMKDDKGKKIKNPVVDGTKLTPAKYLNLLNTKLTWRLDDLTSENPSTQKKILLELFQKELEAVGVIFDSKHPKYKDSILYKIELAKKERDIKDYERKKVGGIAIDLKEQHGVDPERPETIPDFVDILKLENQKIEIERAKAVYLSEIKNGFDDKMNAIKSEAQNVLSSIKLYNNELKTEYVAKSSKIELYRNRISDIENIINELTKKGIIKENVFPNIETILRNECIINFKITEPDYIKLDENGKLIDTSDKPLVLKINELRQRSATLQNSTNGKIDTSEFDDKITAIETEIKEAKPINKIVLAVDAYHNWLKADGEVKRLQNKYLQLLTKINTGISGLKIMPENENIFLYYNGEYDNEYFQNKNKEYRKLSAYSSTQRPMICLLIQAYFLNKKPKASRYLFIDDVPIDRNTQAYMRKIAEELNIRIMANIAGDFDAKTLENGEILIENGEIIGAEYTKPEPEPEPEPETKQENDLFDF